MSIQRFSEGFKAEAVKQVLERGYSVADVADCIGVSAQSLNKWVNAEKPTKDEQREEELKEIRRENPRLKVQLRRVEEERDI